MKARRSAFGIVAFWTMLLCASTASAEFRVCNRSTGPVDVAVAYNDAQHGWTSQGWWVVPSGGCATVIAHPLKSSHYYVYGNGVGGRRWQGAPAQVGGGFCMATKKFTLHNDDFRIGEATINCDRGGMQFRKFVLVDTRHYRKFTYNLLSSASREGPVAGTPQPPVTGGPPGPAGPPIANPPSHRPTSGGPAGSACQRYPNLC